MKIAPFSDGRATLLRFGNFSRNRIGATVDRGLGNADKVAVSRHDAPED
jgi:hypothetical protein